MKKLTEQLKEGIGVLEGFAFEEIVYEGYGPQGIAIILEVITDNKNRTVAELRNIFSKFGGSLESPVVWLGCLKKKDRLS